MVAEHNNGSASELPIYGCSNVANFSTLQELKGLTSVRHPLASESLRRETEQSLPSIVRVTGSLKNSRSPSKLPSQTTHCLLASTRDTYRMCTCGTKHRSFPFYFCKYSRECTALSQKEIKYSGLLSSMNCLYRSPSTCLNYFKKINMNNLLISIAPYLFRELLPQSIFNFLPLCVILGNTRYFQ